MRIMQCTKEEMIDNADHVIAICKPSVMLSFNCEYDGYQTDIVGVEQHDTNAPFEGRCEEAIEQAFLKGAWDSIVIVTNLDDDRKAYVANLIAKQMLEYFMGHGEHADVIFDGATFELKYVLKQEGE